MKKIGIFGGTFDPVHRGHIKIARLARKKFNLDKVIFVPAGVLPHKSGSFAAARDRYNMVKLAVRGKKYLAVSDYEVKKRTPSYTINTVKYFQRKLGRQVPLFFIAGNDAFREIRTWKNWRHLLKLCHFIVINRPGYGPVNPGTGLTGAVSYLRIPGINISATDIRSRLAAGKKAGAMLPPGVGRYIDKNNLYRKK
jgi:nicotinate-nucleotide adenylyltransferase